MNKKLTQKQEEFITYVLQGKTQTEAYRLAYPKAQSWKDSTVRSKASHLINEPHIQSRYRELQQQQQETLIESATYSKEQAIRDLLWIKQKALLTIEDNGYDSKATNSVLKSVQEISKLLGYYPVENKKVDVSVADADLSMPDLSHLSYEELVDLIDRLDKK